ncbi:MAG: glycosyltransferase family 39 protein [Chloroflexi bacterium]|nr:glycosyltransferase family 39 protein [Chloroflexota bacterium]
MLQLRAVPTFFESLGRDLLGDDNRAKRVLACLACLIVTTLLGYGYASQVHVQGWQLWVWVLCVFITLVALFPTTPPPLKSERTWIWLGIIFVAAFFLRALFLETIPGGLHTDETGTAGFSMLQVTPFSSKTINPFRTGPASWPVLYYYIERVSMGLFGATITGLRLPSAFIGALSVVTTYGLIAVMQDKKTALIAAVLMVTFPYHLHWSRLALNNIWDSVWVPLMLGAFVWGWETRWSGGAVVAGFAVGMSQYFYLGSKLGLFMLGMLILQIWFQTAAAERPVLIVHLGKLVLTAAVIAAPLFMFVISNPAAYLTRTNEAYGWSVEAIRTISPDLNVWNYFWHQLTYSVGAFNVYPDVTGFYGPGTPLLIGIASPLFVIGFLWATYERQFLPVLWIVLTVIFGGILLSGAPSSSHFAVSMPAMVWLIAIPLGWLVRRGHWRLAAAVIALIILTDLAFYFGVYVPGHPRDLKYPFPTSG